MKKLFLTLVLVLVSLISNSQELTISYKINNGSIVTNTELHWINNNQVMETEITINKNDILDILSVIDVDNNHYSFYNGQAIVLTYQFSSAIVGITTIDILNAGATNIYTDKSGFKIKINVVDPTAGLKDLSFSDSKLHVFPNPSKDIINVRLNASGDDSYLHIYNIAGQLVYSNKSKLNNGEIEISLKDVEPGTYILKTSEETQMFVKE